MRVNAALTAAVFRHSLSLNSIPRGRANNILMSDPTTCGRSFRFSYTLLVSPIKLVVTFASLVLFLGSDEWLLLFLANRARAQLGAGAWLAGRAGVRGAVESLWHSGSAPLVACASLVTRSSVVRRRQRLDALSTKLSAIKDKRIASVTEGACAR